MQGIFELMKLKQLIILTFLFINPLFPCDYCVVGLQQYYSSENQSSIRIDFRLQQFDGLIRGSNPIQSRDNLKASYSTSYLTYNYSFQQFGISATVPFTSKIQENKFTLDASSFLHFHHGDRSELAGTNNLTDSYIEKYSLNGIGDMVILARYTILQEMSSLFYKINIQAGSTIPTGSIDSRDEFKYLLHPHLQNGTGTSTLLFNVNGFLSEENRSVTASIMIGKPLNSKNKYQEGLGISYDLIYRHQFKPTFLSSESFITTNIGFLGKNIGIEKYNNIKIEDSGGTYIFGVVGTSFLVYENIIFEVNGQFPIYKNLNGTQSNEKLRILTSLMYLL